MKIWGIGTTWDHDMLNEFVSERLATVGWDEQAAPALYTMLREIQVNDIVYLKSYIMNRKSLRIKKIGRVVLPATWHKDYGHDVVYVKWLDAPEHNHEITEEEGRYNVYSLTIYPEYNPSIKQEILESYAHAIQHEL